MRFKSAKSIIRIRSLVALGGLVLPLLAAAGCVRHSAMEARRPRPAGNVASNSGTLDTAGVARSVLYRDAVSAFGRKDYRGALTRIDRLSSEGGLSPAALAFVQHQRELCQDALAGRKPAAARPAVAANQARRPRTPSDADCGPRALLLVCQDLKVPTNLPALRAAAGTTADGTTMAGLAKAAKSAGLQADGVQMDRNALANLSQPAVAWADGNHYIAVLSIHHALMDPSVNGDTATVHDPNKKGEEEMPLDGPTGLLARSGGMLLLLSQYRSN